jgi:hypothetical protein
MARKLWVTGDIKMKKLFGFIITFLVLLTSVLAYNGYGYGFYSPAQWLQNEWVVFGLIFVIFFALIFFGISKTMKENLGVAAVIAFGLSAFIAFTISQRTMFYGYVGEGLGNWFFIIAILIAAVFFIRFVTNLIGGAGLFLALFAIWLVLSNVDPYAILPSQFLYSNYFSLYQFLASSSFLFILVIVFVVLVVASFGKKDINKTIAKWLWAKKEEISVLEKLARTKA